MTAAVEAVGRAVAWALGSAESRPWYGLAVTGRDGFEGILWSDAVSPIQRRGLQLEVVVLGP